MEEAYKIKEIKLVKRSGYKMVSTHLKKAVKETHDGR